MACLCLPPLLRLAVYERHLAAAASSALCRASGAASASTASTQQRQAGFAQQRRNYATVNDIPSVPPDIRSDNEQLSQRVGTLIADLARRSRIKVASSIADETDQQTVLLKLLDRRARRHANKSAWQSMRKAALAHARPLAVLEHLGRKGNLPKGVRRAAAEHGTPVETHRPGSETVETPAKGNDYNQIYNQMKTKLPTQADYPNAALDLFLPDKCAMVVHGRCRQLKIALQIDVDFTMHRPARNAVLYVCNLKADFQNVCEETATGESGSKLLAKRAAWVQLIAQMHASGALRTLFSEDGDEAVDGEDSVPLLEPAALDKETIEEEKGARAEIYNYAAGLGYIPSFEVEVVQPRTSRARPGKARMRAKAVVKVTIRLPELELEAMGVGKDLEHAEVAAALIFKRKAEERRGVDGVAPSSPGLLNVDTALPFFTFYREARQQTVLEIEYEAVKQGKIDRHAAHLTIDGKAIGGVVVMNSKKQAADIAYLAAAVELTKAEPELLRAFEQRLKKDGGKVLRSLRPIDLSIDTMSTHLMQRGLVEARNAGLPDWPNRLSAVAPDSEWETLHRSRRALSPSETEARSQRMTENQRVFEHDPSLSELRSKKATLPMTQYRSQVVEMVSANQYSIVVGATGSGKTTQVPQILLEHAVTRGMGGACDIVCTQPRRIAATSVAQRVANERNERLQETVGYNVRFDNKSPKSGGSITYCTTGKLLEQLKADPDGMLDSFSHILIDEVHERDLNIDFLMIVLKKAVQKRLAAARSTPKVVLMSATLDVDKFAQYLGTNTSGVQQPCPSLSVPGRTFPVKYQYLGDIMHDLMQDYGKEYQALLKLDRSSSDFLKAEVAFSAARDLTSPTTSLEPVIDWKGQHRSSIGPEADSSSKEEHEEALVPVALLAATIAHVCDNSTEGAILAFLPGLEDIIQTRDILMGRTLFGVDFSDHTKYKICLLHSSVPKNEQDEIFAPVPPGCRKIILSTNIAETSVTVADVKYVLDTGKLREVRYDQVRRITKLQCVWESKSNSTQRAGRAGRVQNGFYYALFSKERHDALRAVGVPELLRTDLQRTCLSIRAQKFDEPVEEFLAQAIEPPPAQAVQAAVQSLKAVEAFTEDEQLTHLGALLAKLPVHPTLAKMIVLGVIFRCLDPMLVLGAAAEERTLFIRPIGHDSRAAAGHARRAFSGGEASDHLAVYEGFKELRSLQNRYGTSAAFESAREKYLHFGAFRNIHQTAQQIVKILSESGLFAWDSHSSNPQNQYFGPAELNTNANNPSLIKCLLLAGVHPNLGARSGPNTIAFRTAAEQNVLIHPSSPHDDSGKHKKNHAAGTLFTYSTLAKSNDGHTLHMRDTTLVTPLMAALFGGRLRMVGSMRLEMDDWLPLFVQAGDRRFAAKLVLEFRKALERVLSGAFQSLEEFVEDPVREGFVRRVVELLDQQARGQKGGSGYLS